MYVKNKNKKNEEKKINHTSIIDWESLLKLTPSSLKDEVLMKLIGHQANRLSCQRNNILAPRLDET